MPIQLSHPVSADLAAHISSDILDAFNLLCIHGPITAERFWQSLALSREHICSAHSIHMSYGNSTSSTELGI